jgi:uncharacterized protein
VENDQLRVDKIQVIFKIVERCNINCDYCYYFNMGDKSALGRKSTVTVSTAEQLAQWLAVGCQELATTEVLICFHGGEPMLFHPERFDAICAAIENRLGKMVRLRFGIQTNGTIATRQWLSVLDKHQVSVGISIDGGPGAHNRHRLDHRGKSTFEKTKDNLKAFVRIAEDTHPKAIWPATLSVLDWRNDYAEEYVYLRKLGVRRMSFLLPDRNVDDGFRRDSGETPQKYGEALFDIFKAWLTEDDPSVEVLFIKEFLDKLQCAPSNESRNSDVEPDGERSFEIRWSKQILVVHSDGAIGVSDAYIPALAWYLDTPKSSIFDTSLRSFLMSGVYDEICRANNALPIACRECEWRRFCRGGDNENRYSKKNGFDNPSVYCDSYKVFFEKACRLLVENGYPAERLSLLMASR